MIIIQEAKGNGHRYNKEQKATYHVIKFVHGEMCFRCANIITAIDNGYVSAVFHCAQKAFAKMLIVQPSFQKLRLWVSL